MTSALGLRGGLRRLSNGFIAYGIVGLVVAAIGFGSLVWVNGRISTLRGEVESTLNERAATLGVAARLLREASTAAGSFTVTMEQASQAVSSAADTITQVGRDLPAVEAQLRAVTILGASPLSTAADAVGRIASSLEGLDIRLSLIADSLEGNRQALAGVAATIGQLGDATESLAGRLGSEVIGDSVGDIQQVISITLLVLAAWMLVPAVGALVFGVWLRRAMSRSRSS